MDSQQTFDQLRNMDMFAESWASLDGNQSSTNSPDSQSTTDPSGWNGGDAFPQTQGSFSFDEFLRDPGTTALHDQEPLAGDHMNQITDDSQLWQTSKGYGETGARADTFVIDDIGALTAPMLSSGTSDSASSSVVPSGGVPSSSMEFLSMFEAGPVCLEEGTQDILDASVPRLYSQQDGGMITPRNSRQFQPQQQSVHGMLKDEKESPQLYEPYLPRSSYHGTGSNFNHHGYPSHYGGPGHFNRLTPRGSQDFAGHAGSGSKRHGRKQSISKIPLNELFKLMDLGNNHPEAKAREARIMQILQDSGFEVGGKTWMRDTTADIRRAYMDTLVAKTTDYGYPRSTLEMIVRRGTYARMQSNLRKARRKSKASQGRIDKREYANVAQM